MSPSGLFALKSTLNESLGLRILPESPYREERPRPDAIKLWPATRFRPVLISSDVDSTYQSRHDQTATAECLKLQINTQLKKVQSFPVKYWTENIGKRKCCPLVWQVKLTFTKNSKVVIPERGSGAIGVESVTNVGPPV
ncbi:hypothetical protein AG1IA_06705 [Rhizoctonia solani AG-1 IA]|uniref:Uncharacterized protein n=1 Tax=Thanatephorus cucumeris (strain AG1-IA) TaxID=983506 RepID=L8WM82_THACA|nr:hypothetical protein AG1IA_06705 [Rhizoctonia solani AG-1 IA]